MRTFKDGDTYTDARHCGSCGQTVALMHMTMRLRPVPHAEVNRFELLPCATKVRTHYRCDACSL